MSRIINDCNITFIRRDIAGIVSRLFMEPKIVLRELENVCYKIYASIPWHADHGKNVALFAVSIGQRLCLDEPQLVILEAAAQLHDIGKFGISKVVLSAVNSLTRAQKKEIQLHVVNAYYLLSGISGIGEVLDAVCTHHERWDGRGYPNCLCRNQIPLFGRIIAVADAYDAMTSERPYRKARSTNEAIQELKSACGTQFDKELVDIFIETFA